MLPVIVSLSKPYPELDEGQLQLLVGTSEIKDP